MMSAEETAGLVKAPRVRRTLEKRQGVGGGRGEIAGPHSLSHGPRLETGSTVLGLRTLETKALKCGPVGCKDAEAGNAQEFTQSPSAQLILCGCYVSVPRDYEARGSVSLDPRDRGAVSVMSSVKVAGRRRLRIAFSSVVVNVVLYCAAVQMLCAVLYYAVVQVLYVVLCCAVVRVLCDDPRYCAVTCATPCAVLYVYCALRASARASMCADVCSTGASMRMLVCSAV